jgi:hypothetical protein
MTCKPPDSTRKRESVSSDRDWNLVIQESRFLALVYLHLASLAFSERDSRNVVVIRCLPEAYQVKPGIGKEKGRVRFGGSARYNDLIDNPPINVRQAKIAAGVAVGQLRLVEPRQAEDGGGEVVNVDPVLVGVTAERVGLVGAGDRALRVDACNGMARRGSSQE